MKPDDDLRDEEFVSSLMNSTNRDMPPPDPQFLARLRDQSTQAFLEAAAQAADQTSAAGTQSEPQRYPGTQPAAPVQPPPRRRSMLGFALKILTTCAAAIAIGTVGFQSFFGTHHADQAFGDILQRLTNARTLHLTVTRDGRESDVWYAAPNLMRWDDADGTYQIARGDTLWRVDEKENRAAPEPTDLFDSGRDGSQRIDILALLGLDPAAARAVLESRVLPRRIERNGQNLLQYELRYAQRDNPLVIEALVDIATGQLTAFDIHTDRNGGHKLVAELSVVGVNAPIADEKFVVSDTLTDDGRIGKVVEVQGLVSIRPVMQERWTAVCEKLLLRPGDWIRTDNRGANAVQVQLVKQSRLILGPGSLVEVVSPTLIRAHSGEFEVTPAEGAQLEVVGPGDQKATVQKPQVFRIKDDKLVVLEHEPSWLKGFKGQTNSESIGSLIAKVDGRNVPLTVGYHKVNVEIRDQIARTVIEESFVNRTPTQLEGVFYFPLPDDASISGFGMWIGNELVEADIVEKQRAREIYETILRERRDPGLLEWTGGNLFKARVFPIPGNAEKRIKISYTQVLPARGHRYRYSYALQSDLLKLHPLRDLSIDVTVNSANSLKNVSSPTHTVRGSKTAHSARVEFNAREYTPTRDFEVVIETEGKQSDLVMIPHRRGEDGYFMLQLTPPAAGEWQRELLPDGKPLELVILADTSASMDSGQRQRQAEVVAALLGALTPRDQVNLAGCDVDCDWVFEKPAAAEPANMNKIRTFLETRRSLGWTDLDAAFAAAFKQSGPNTHIIYIGDGIVTTGDARPEGFAQRVRQAYREGSGMCHAVTVGSSFESAVLQAIASLGSGSLRRVTGEDRPQSVATALLREIARPGLRNLKVDFRGFQTARVYPSELTNLPVGAQQILLGRYLPIGTDQSGDVVVTALQGNEPVKFAARVSFRDAEEGNSFIPRLWAKMHLESLLAQGASQAIRDEVIALSEDFQIMTPYTSFLVLETDADRERFKVQRRFRMRDGEKFFQEGADNARFELVQQQMKRAGNWRLGLRRMALNQLTVLGRDSALFQSRLNGPYGGPISSRSAGMAGRFGGGKPASGGGDWFYESEFAGETEEAFMASDGRLALRDKSSKDRNLLSDRLDLNGPEAAEPMESKESAFDSPVGQKAELASRIDEFDRLEAAKQRGAEPADVKRKLALIDAESMFENEFLGNGAMGDFGSIGGFGGGFGPASSTPYFRGGMLGRRSNGYWNQPDYVSWVNTLFPVLPAAGTPAPGKLPKETWPAAARELSQSLLRTEKLGQLNGGLEIGREAQGFEARWNELTSRHQRLDLYTRERWLTRTTGDSSQTMLHWADKVERGVMGLAFGLGRTRKSVAADLAPAVLDRSDFSYLGLNDHSLTPLHESFRGYTPTIEQDNNRILLILKVPHAPDHETRIEIDSVRHVIISIEQRQKGKVTTRSKFDEFVEVAGLWWAGKLEVTDAEGRRTWLVTQDVKLVAAEEIAAQIAAGLAIRDKVLLLQMPLPEVASAKRAQARLGELQFETQLVLLLHFAQSQQWKKVFDMLESCRQIAGDKRGFEWVRNAVLSIGRRNEELKGRLLTAAGEIVAGQWPIGGPAVPQPPVAAGDEQFLSDYLLGQAGSVLEGNEMLQLLERLKPVYERQPAHRKAEKSWRERKISTLQSIGQPDAAAALQRQLAIDYPRDYGLQQRHAQTLFSNADYDAAYDWLTKALAGQPLWHDYERDSLRSAYAQFLQQQGRYADLVIYLERWIEASPENQTVQQQYLSALIQSDQVPRYEALLAEWLKPGTGKDDLAPPALARLNAAIALALGNGYYFYTDRIDEKWHSLLADIIVATARSRRDLNPAAQIMNHWRFQSTDAARRARGEIAALVVESAATLPPDRLQQFLQWIMRNDPPVTEATWRTIGDKLKARWLAENDPDARRAIAGPLATVLGRLASAELLAFLREQLATSPEQFRAAAAGQLFDTLLAQGWEQALEDEAFSLLERLSDSEEPAERLWAQVSALYRLTDAMVKARHQLAMSKLELPPDLAPREQKKKSDEQLQLAQQGFADRLQIEIARHAAPLTRWLAIERIYLDTLARRNLAAVAAESWDTLAGLTVAPPPAADDEAVQAPAAEITRRLDLALQGRYVATLMYLATRPGADADLIARMRKYLDGQITAEPAARRWKALKFQLLLALDRPRELKEVLTAWLAGDDPDSRWRLTLGYVLAELGSVPEAIALFEGVEVADELGPTEYQALAGWYLAANRRAEYERALARIDQTREEYQMNQALQQMLNPWQRGGSHLPSQLDERVLRMLAALFQKSSAPQNYLGYLQQFYQASHDFRLLAVLTESVIGQSTGKVYPFLQQMQGVLSEIRDEAVADQLREEIGKVRQRARTTVDQRALDLLEVQVERRAAEVKNQPGPHAAAALAALKRAFEREWSAGEQRLMADLLAGLGTISVKSLAEEQLRQATALFNQQSPGTFDRLHVGQRFAEVQWNQGRQQEAVDTLQNALKEFQESQGGILPVSANPALALLIQYHDNRHHFTLAEQVVFDQLRHPVHGQQRLFLEQKKYEIYRAALQNKGEVSIGSGAVLFRELEKQLIAALNTSDQNHRFNLVALLCSVYRSAFDQKIAEAGPALLAFSDKVLPGVLKQQTSNYTSIVHQVAQILHDIVNARAGLAFLIERIEHEPGWFHFSNQDGWAQFGSLLSGWRVEVPNLGDLEPRLLKIVLGELRRDLESQQQRSRQIYWPFTDRYFWKEKTEDFAREAEAVYTRQKGSGAAVQYIADYLFHGLAKKDRAIEMLFIAHREKRLDEPGRSKLVSYLQAENRFGESAALLEPLIEEYPNDLNYRVALMRAYFRTKRPAELRALLAKTDEYFHQDKRWSENALASLAGSCLETELYEDCVKYSKELIPLHEKSQPNRGIGNGTLSNYYAVLSGAYAGLKQTADAVDAACGAIVSWGPTNTNRANSLESLKNVLRWSPDLAAYVAQLDKLTDSTSEDRPIVRKALGQVFLEQGRIPQALAQLQKAVALEPNDTETQQALIACFDKTNDREGAIGQILQLTELTRRDIALFQNLGQRYTTLERPRDAERAYTSIVEALPTESESHALLAEIREKQNRWTEAMGHWEQVARIRALEPTGLLRLAAAQIHEKEWEPARESLRKLDVNSWPPRFGDVRGQVRNMERQIEAGAKK